jgi:hypothetical protein
MPEILASHSEGADEFQLLIHILVVDADGRAARTVIDARSDQPIAQIHDQKQ